MRELLLRDTSRWAHPAVLRRTTVAALATLATLSVVAGCQKTVPTGESSNSRGSAASTLAPAQPQGPLVGKGRRFVVTLTFTPSAPKVSQLFSVRTVVSGLDGVAITPSMVEVNASMPAHGHGMMTKPEHHATGDGAWRSDGMKLHMHGRWLFAVKVQAGADSETISIPFDQPPEAF